ncbi:MAG TPA: hypothetical protein ACFYD0_01945 [Candidatus Wunengus sp. YC65]|uniref:hypothetical protein n=1 Tax=Candidatus Wunengus sp. YC65 TaxID=3367701 RepID=UPI004024D4C1
MSLSTARFEVLSFPFELTTDDKKFFDEFLELNSALTLPGNGKLPQVQYSVIKNTKYFCIRENGKFRNRWAHRWPLYLSVMMCVRDSLYLHLKEYLFLHAGALAKNNKAVLLPGPSGSGKSTLTLGLLNYGYQYLTDEVVVIDLSDLRVLPFQRPVYIYGWQSVVSAEVEKYFKFYRFKERYGNTLQPWQYAVPQQEAILPKDTSFEVAWIVFPTYNETQKDSYLKPMSRAEAAFNLMQNGWNTQYFADFGLKLCSELVKKADCYELVMGDLKEACELIEGLTGKTPASVESEALNNIWKQKVLL